MEGRKEEALAPDFAEAISKLEKKMIQRDNSGIAKEITVQVVGAEPGNGMTLMKYNSGRVDMVIFHDCIDYVSSDVLKEGVSFEQLEIELMAAVEQGKFELL